jgi:hypothetical protein
LTVLSRHFWCLSNAPCVCGPQGTSKWAPYVPAPQLYCKGLYKFSAYLSTQWKCYP